MLDPNFLLARRLANLYCRGGFGNYRLVWNDFHALASGSIPNDRDMAAIVDFLLHNFDCLLAQDHGGIVIWKSYEIHAREISGWALHRALIEMREENIDEIEEDYIRQLEKI